MLFGTKIVVISVITMAAVLFSSPDESSTENKEKWSFSINKNHMSTSVAFLIRQWQGASKTRYKTKLFMELAHGG